MKAKQNLNPDPRVIKSLMDLNKKRDFLLLEKELIPYLKEFQDSPFLNNMLGLTLANQGKLEESLDSFNVAIKSSEDKSAYLNNLGITFSKLDRLNEAISAFSKSADFDVLNVNTHFFLGMHSGKQEE